MPDTPTFPSAAVAAPHYLASATGKGVLAEGGNAIEAMIAMAATIAVVYPHMNGIGGDGFWVVREPGGRVRAIEACGQAGAHAKAASYRPKGHHVLPFRGPDAALTVAGAVGGWAMALEYARALGGKTPLPDLLADAIRYAGQGCPVSDSELRTIPNERDALYAAPGFADAFLFEGKPPKAGDVRRLPALAATLSQLASAGLDDFYRGDVGREIASDLERIGAPGDAGRLRGVRGCPARAPERKAAGRDRLQHAAPQRRVSRLSSYSASTSASGCRAARTSVTTMGSLKQRSARSSSAIAW
jgi:gamma-glutamyltranspeptidase/glutathione hydrolase